MKSCSTVRWSPTSQPVTEWNVASRWCPRTGACSKRLTVRENLELGAYLRSDTDKIAEDMQRIFELFPRVKQRLSQKAGTLSGGEQQMVAVGRALMSSPRVLLMDEPSMGLAPTLIQQNFELIQLIHLSGVTVFMVEQNANMALSIADRGWVLQTGRVVLDDTADNLLAHPELQASYLGKNQHLKTHGVQPKRQRWLCLGNTSMPPVPLWWA